MADRVSPYLGKKYACPECQARLKFRRPPTSLLQTCPNCRRKLTLQEQTAVADKDELVREAIDSLVAWKAPKRQTYDYGQDPQLDRVDDSVSGVWKFDQPWPERIQQMVVERAEVLLDPIDVDGNVRSRQLLFDGRFRRVTVAHTRQVEEMEVVGYWWDHEPHESRMGILPRKVVRQLNRIVTAHQFAARINCIQSANHDDQEMLALFVDLAVQEVEKPQSQVRPRWH